MLAGESRRFLEAEVVRSYDRHNLIAIGGVAAAMGTAAAMRTHGVPGRVILLGTPAEEGGAGKVKLLDAGACEAIFSTPSENLADR